MTEEEDRQNPPFVTFAQCKEFQGHLIDTIRDTKKDLKKIKDSLYGIEEGGQMKKEGLVGLVGDLVDSEKTRESALRWFLEKIAIPIVTVIISAFVIVNLL